MLLRRLPDWPTGDRTSPFEELDRMRGQMDFLNREPGAGVFPLMNVTEDNDNYHIRAELPGIKTDELDISVTGESLTVSGERNIHGSVLKASVWYETKVSCFSSNSGVIFLTRLNWKFGVLAF